MSVCSINDSTQRTNLMRFEALDLFFALSTEIMPSKGGVNVFGGMAVWSVKRCAGMPLDKQ